MQLRRASRRRAMGRMLATSLAVPMTYRCHAGAPPSETVYHASLGAAGMAGSDIRSLSQSKHFKLVAVADVDLDRTKAVRKQFPDCRVYQDWRELLDKEKKLDSVNVSTPDHMHAPIAMRAIERGLHVYGQKPLTRTIFEARQVTLAAKAKNIVTQMGIQIHSAEEHRMVVAILQAGAIGKVKEVHSWSGKFWGDANPLPSKTDPVPKDLNWDSWLGVAAARPYISGYYHPSEWRKRIDFGTGTFGDMGCHILDPVFSSLELGFPKSIRSEGPAPNAANWAIDAKVRYEFSGTKFTADSVSLFWCDGNERPPAEIQKLVGGTVSDQGSIYIGTDGVLYSPYVAAPILFPKEKFQDHKLPRPGAQDHYLQFVDACRGEGKTSAPFSYAGPMTESILLGCLSTRFPKTTLEWNAAELKFDNVAEANAFVKPTYRKGWEI